MIRAIEAASGAELTRQVAEDYRSKGYEVSLQPGPDQLPPSLAGYRPDFVARKGDETVVVEIKSRPTSRREPPLESLAKAVRALPGWRLDLVMAEPDIAFPLPGRTLPWTTQEAGKALDEADRLLEAGHAEAALLMAWAGTEATLRLVAEREGIKAERNEANFLLERLTTEGVLGQREYQLLRDALALRNAVAHGLKPDIVVRSKVPGLLRTARGLLEPSLVS
jgi:Holliday junction resolvase